MMHGSTQVQVRSIMGSSITSVHRLYIRCELLEGPIVQVGAVGQVAYGSL
jgi:hypothetical protein